MQRDCEPTVTAGSRAAWRFSGAALTALSVLGGALSIGYVLAGDRTAAAAPGASGLSGLFPARIERLEIVDVDMDGDVTLTPSGTGQVDVGAPAPTQPAPAVRQERRGNTLRITGRCGRAPCATGYAVRVPAGLAVRARTSAGAVTSHGLPNEQQLESASGEIRVAGATGRLVLRSASGNIVGTGVASRDADAQTAAGQVTLAYTADPDQVTIGSAAGGVWLTVPGAGQPRYRVQVEAPAGAATVGVAQDPGARHAVTARARFGAVEIRYG